MATYAKRDAPLAREQGALVLALIAVATAAWFLTERRMAGMDAGPGTDPGAFGFYVSSWVLMMAAMMFPSIVPMVLVYRLAQRRRSELRPAASLGSTPLFVGGYLISWAAFGGLAYALFVGVRSASIGAFSWHRGGPYVAGAVLLAAALYQVTPAKDACLRRCRGPLQFITHAWRDGPMGALRMGVEHGAWCVGCCWALMAGLFALGVMSVGWMLLIAALIAAEKLLPWKTTANLAVAAIMAARAIAVALTPSSVPGLTIPGSAPAEKAMSVTGHSPIEVHARPGPTTSQMSIRAHTKQGKTMGHMQTGAHAKTGRR